MDYQAASETVTREWTFPHRARTVRRHDCTRTRNRTRKTAARDFRIAAAHHIAESSLPEKALANIKAIRTLRLVETGNHDATEAGNSVLVRYAGWGAMANVFSPPIRRRNTSLWRGISGAARDSPR